MNDTEPPPKEMMRWIAWAVWVWGGALALGSYFMFEVNGVRTYNIYRPLIVLGCVGVFQLIWLAVSTASNRKFAARKEDEKK